MTAAYFRLLVLIQESVALVDDRLEAHSVALDAAVFLDEIVELVGGPFSGLRVSFENSVEGLRQAEACQVAESAAQLVQLLLGRVDELVLQLDRELGQVPFQSPVYPQR